MYVIIICMWHLLLQLAIMVRAGRSQNTWAPLIALHMIYLLSMGNLPHIHCLFSTLLKEKVIIIIESLWRWNWYKMPSSPDMNGSMYINAVVYSAFCVLLMWKLNLEMQTSKYSERRSSVALVGKGHTLPLVGFPLWNSSWSRHLWAVLPTLQHLSKSIIPEKGGFKIFPQFLPWMQSKRIRGLSLRVRINTA